MDELPAQAAAMTVARPIAGDAAADLAETTELFDVDMHHLAGHSARSGGIGAEETYSCIARTRGHPVPEDAGNCPDLRLFALPEVSLRRLDERADVGRAAAVGLEYQTDRDRRRVEAVEQAHEPTLGERALDLVA